MHCGIISPILQATQSIKQDFLPTMSFAIITSSRFARTAFALLAFSSIGIADGAHPNPMDILSGRTHHRSPTSPRTPPQQEVIHLQVQPAQPTQTHRKKPHTRPHSTSKDESVEGMILPPRPKRAVVHVHTATPNAVVQRRHHTHPLGETNRTHEANGTRAETEHAGDSELPTGKRLEKLLAMTERLTPSAMEQAYHAAKEKTLYMTFDDGPIGGTANLLRVLKEENVKATMFCIGREVVRHPKLFHQELAMPNLLVANHTYTHANNHYRRFYNSPAAHVVADIDKAQRAIGGAKYLRLCGRNVWRLPMVKRDDWGISVAQRGREIPKYNALWEQGYFTYGWDVEWLFSHKTQRPLFDGAEMARRVNLRYQGAHTAKRGKVVLLAHDFMFRSAYNTQQLRTFIRIMKGQGWIFKTVDDYSRETPGVYYAEKKTPVDKLRPAQKVARQAAILTPPVHATVTQKGNGNTAIHLPTQLEHAIRSQSFIDIRRLLALGADINGRTPEGKIPLNIAIETNNAVLVRMLVERGARIFNLDAYGMSPMGIAQKQNSTVIIRYLQQQITRQKQRRLKQTVFSSSESFSDR